jgi:hypothetical protein
MGTAPRAAALNAQAAAQLRGRMERSQEWPEGGGGDEQLCGLDRESRRVSSQLPARCAPQADQQFSFHLLV